LSGGLMAFTSGNGRLVATPWSYERLPMIDG
jgi:hypothetical protein